MTIMYSTVLPKHMEQVCKNRRKLNNNISIQSNNSKSPTISTMKCIINLMRISNQCAGEYNRKRQRRGTEYSVSSQTVLKSVMGEEWVWCALRWILMDLHGDRDSLSEADCTSGHCPAPSPLTPRLPVLACPALPHVCSDMKISQTELIGWKFTVCVPEHFARCSNDPSDAQTVNPFCSRSRCDLITPWFSSSFPHHRHGNPPRDAVTMTTSKEHAWAQSPAVVAALVTWTLC